MTTPKPIIFLSHSSQDIDIASELAKQIELELNWQVNVFASTRPTAIASGSDWFDKVFLNLNDATVLIVLLTPASVQSAWVGFETGYFWKKTNGNNIHILYHPKANIPSPLNTLQAKLITNKEQIADVFEQLCNVFNQPFERQANLDAILSKAQNIKLPASERTLKRFEELLETSEWMEGYIGDLKTWTCVDDNLYQITDNSIERDDFRERWTEGFPDNHSSKSIVHLKIGGSTVAELYFIALDGGRYFVPMPEVRALERDEVIYFWNRNSLRFKVGQRISYFHLNQSFESFAEKQGIEIISDNQR